MTLDAQALARILLLQNMITQLEDQGELLSFTCRGLEEIPGIKDARYSAEGEESSPTDENRCLPLKYNQQSYGEICLILSDAEAFKPYLSYINNLCFMIAMVLEERRQSQLNRQHQQKLESLVDERTKELQAEILERKHAEEMALKARQRAEHYLDVSEAMILELNREGTIRIINKRGCEILGYRPENLIGRNWFELCLPPHVVPVVKEVFNSAMNGGEDFAEYFENEIIDSAGNLHYFAWHNDLQRDETGKIVGVLCSGIDVSAYRQVEQQLRASKERLDLIIKGSNDAPWDWSLETNELFYSSKWWEQLGMVPDELSADAALWERLMHPDDAERVRGVLKETLAGSVDSYEVEFRLKHKDGSYVPILSRGFISRDEAGTPVRMSGTNMDLTERKKSEAELFQANAILQAAMDCSPAGIAIADAPDGKLRYVNKAGMLFRGEDEEAVLEDMDIDQYVRTWQLFDLDGRALELDEVPLARALLYGEHCSREFIVRRNDMDDRFVMAKAAPILDQEDDVVSAVVVFMDITQRKRDEEERQKIEKQMVQAQKLESLGVLAGGIAHDFNNLLAAIMGHAELTRRRLPPEAQAIENLKQIELATERASDLAKQMLAYSGKGKFVVEALNLNRLLEEMLHMLKVSISKKAVLRLDTYSSLPSIDADATQIRQVIMNLVINASEAIGDRSGVISIFTGCMDCDQEYLKGVWLEENLVEGLYVYLEVADTGCGMAAETLEKLFDPFFTTKFTGRGLGMSAVLGIVRGHKGAIKIYSEPGKGTNFKILLPASEKPEEIFSGDAEDNDWLGTGKVLLVDDEETVRGIGVEMLKELGFQPLTANDGREALEVFRNNPDIKLVILDLTMPKMDGQQCFRELKALDPKLKVIISSGYNEFEVSQRFMGKGLAGFIQKPYKLSTLRDVIKKL